MQNEHYLNQLLTKNLIKIDKNTIYLTRSGKLLADQIAAELFVRKKLNCDLSVIWYFS